MRFTISSSTKKSPFEMHFGRKPRTKITNLTNGNKSLLSDWSSVSANPGALQVYVARDGSGNISDHIVMADKVPKRVRNIPPYYAYERSRNPKSFSSKYKQIPCRIISETDHTVKTDKGKIIHKKLISNPITFQQQKGTLKRDGSPSKRGSNPKCGVSESFYH